MRHLLLALALSAPIGGAATARVAFESPITAVTQGIFCSIDTVGQMDAPGTAAGHIDLFSRTPEFRWTGSVVPAVPQLSFGVLVETQDAVSVPETVITLTHPPLKGSGITTQTYVTVLGGSDGSVNAYTFDIPEELVTGDWIFTASRGGQELYSAHFTVVTPEQAPQIAAGCQGNFIS